MASRPLPRSLTRGFGLLILMALLVPYLNRRAARLSPIEALAMRVMRQTRPALIGEPSPSQRVKTPDQLFPAFPTY